MTKVSTIIPAYNAEAYIQEAIESVLSQTYNNIELIVVDDGSTDKTGEIVKDFGSKLEYIRHSGNKGLSAARNRGIKQAKGEYIAFLDADDVWMPTKIEEQIALLDNNQEIRLCFSDAYIIDEEGRRGKNLFKICPAHSGMVFKELLKDNFIPVITAVVKKEVFKETGLFNPRYRIAQDWDFFLRLAKQYPVAFINRPLAEYRIHAGSFSRQRDIMLTEAISIINKYTDSLDKATARTVEMRKRKFQFDLGVIYLQEGMRNKARDFFLAKVREEPFSFCFYLGLLVTFLPDSWIKFIGQIVSANGLYGSKYTQA